MEIEDEQPAVWFGYEVRLLGPSGEATRTGVVRGVSRPWRGRPWSFTVEVDGEADLVTCPAEHLLPTGWFRDAEGRRLSAEEHERAGRGGQGERARDRMRRRHVTLRSHVEASGADEAAARTSDLVAALGLDPVEVDEPVEYWKVPGTWIVVTEVAWPPLAGDDAEVAISHLTPTTGLTWGPPGGTAEGCDAVWNPGDVVGPRLRHVTWMVLEAIP